MYHGPGWSTRSCLQVLFCVFGCVVEAKFLICMNDIPNIITSTAKLFANDTKIYKHIYMILRLWTNLNLMVTRERALVIGSQHRPVSQLLSFTAIDDSVINASHSASNIGVIFDNNLNMERQVAAICESAFLHMRNISCIRKFLSAESTKLFTHAFVMCRLDNCNSLLYRLPNYLIHRL